MNNEWTVDDDHICGCPSWPSRRRAWACVEREKEKIGFQKSIDSIDSSRLQWIDFGMQPPPATCARAFEVGLIRFGGFPFFAVAVVLLLFYR